MMRRVAAGALALTASAALVGCARNPARQYAADHDSGPNDKVLAFLNDAKATDYDVVQHWSNPYMLSVGRAVCTDADPSSTVASLGLDSRGTFLFVLRAREAFCPHQNH